MQIKVFQNFSKRINSTKQPTGGTQVTVLLKGECSVLDPVFELNTLDFSINYVEAFGHYYFCDVVNLDGHRSELHCRLDHLATFKSQISAYTCMVARSAGAYEVEIFDPMIYPTGMVVQSVVTEGNLLSGWDDAGSYVVTTVGQNGLKLYVLTLGQIQNLFNTFFDITFSSYLDPANIPQSVEKAIQALFVSVCNPSQYVKRIQWFPFNMASSTTEMPYFGFVPGNAAVPIAKNGITANAAITLPARYYNDYRDFDSRFTSANVFLPGCGSVSLDPKYLESSLSALYTIDAATGACQIMLIANGQTKVATMACQMGCDINIGGVTGSNTITGITSAIATAASGNFAGTVDNIAGAIQDRLSPSQNSMSAAGNRHSLLDNSFIQVDVTRLGSTEYPTATSGRCTYKNLQLGNLSGYVQCQNASLDIPGDGAEQDTVNSYLNSGFYLE